MLNVNDFSPEFLAPGQAGVPPCDASGCDIYESLFGYSGRNMFRAPFQVRFDMTLGKTFPINDRFRLRFNIDAFNLFNHPDFDAPNNDVTFFPGFSGRRLPARRQPGQHPAHHRQPALPAVLYAFVVLTSGCGTGC